MPLKQISAAARALAAACNKRAHRRDTTTKMEDVRRGHLAIGRSAACRARGSRYLDRDGQASKTALAGAYG